MKVEYDYGYLFLAWHEGENFKLQTDSFKQVTLNIVGKERHFRVESFAVYKDDRFLYKPRESYEVRLIEISELKTKSKEEIAAEESVKKAEEALKAAKEVRSKVKEK